MRKTIVILILITVGSAHLFTEQNNSSNSVLYKPGLLFFAAAEFPVKTDIQLFETVGARTSVQAFFPLERLKPLYLDGSISYGFQKMRSENSLSLVSISLGGGLLFNIGNRFQVQAGGGIGAYIGFLNLPAIDPESGDLYSNQSGFALFWNGRIATKAGLWGSRTYEIR